MSDQFNQNSVAISRIRETHARLTATVKDQPGLVLSIQISDLGPFVYGRKGSLAVTHVVDWLELDRARVNPLDLALDRTLRDLSTPPQESN